MVHIHFKAAVLKLSSLRRLEISKHAVVWWFLFYNYMYIPTLRERALLQSPCLSFCLFCTNFWNRFLCSYCRDWFLQYTTKSVLYDELYPAYPLQVTHTSTFCFPSQLRFFRGQNRQFSPFLLKGLILKLVYSFSMLSCNVPSFPGQLCIYFLFSEWTSAGIFSTTC